MIKDDCIFCKLANGEFPTNSIYEDERFNVILDLAPATKGHALILPKEHFANLYEIPEDWVADAMKLAKKLATHMTEVLECDGFNVVQNNGECAGQTVFHFHLHLIPRYKDDGQQLLWNPMSSTKEELQKIRDILAQ